MKVPPTTTILSIPGTDFGVALGALQLDGDGERNGDEVVFRFKQTTQAVRRDEDGEWQAIEDPS